MQIRAHEEGASSGKPLNICLKITKLKMSVFQANIYLTASTDHNREKEFVSLKSMMKRSKNEVYSFLYTKSRDHNFQQLRPI